MVLARLIGAADPRDVALAAARACVPRSLIESVEAVSLLLSGLDPGSAQALADVVAAIGGAASIVPGHRAERPGTAVLAAPTRLLERIAEQLGDTAPQLARALTAALGSEAAPPPLRVGDRAFEFGGRIALMGVVNVTPDSFSDGGRFFDAVAAVAQGVRLAEAGADLLDVGGESTRPGSAAVPAEEEIRRVVPVIRALRERTRVPIGIDTRKSAVAQAAIDEGAALVNDVSALEHDPDLARVVAAAGVPVCLMHLRGVPETMQKDPRYGDAVEEVIAFLAGAVERAVAAGIRRERVVVDPGIGFGKTYAHNHFLLRRLRDLRILGRPVLVGFSRKGFLGALAGGKPASERVLATAACAAAVAMTGGADFLRVHDVAEVREALAVAQAIRGATGGGELFATASPPRSPTR
jgi:dihydropteroate synthase